MWGEFWELPEEILKALGEILGTSGHNFVNMRSKLPEFPKEILEASRENSLSFQKKFQQLPGEIPGASG